MSIQLLEAPPDRKSRDVQARRMVRSTLVSMEEVSIRELNQETSRVLARVRRGESIMITDRGKPIARLMPVTGGLSVLARMAAEGHVVPADLTGPLPVPPSLGDPAVEVAAEIAAAREDERW